MKLPATAKKLLCSAWHLNKLRLLYASLAYTTCALANTPLAQHMNAYNSCYTAVCVAIVVLTTMTLAQHMNATVTVAKQQQYVQK
jgi:hypothetical protein